MAMPVNEKTFKISVEGQFTKQRFEGDFTFKCKMTMAEKYKLEIERSRMKSDIQTGTEGLENIISILSILKIKVLKAPEWWTQSSSGMDLIDDNVVLEVYEKSLDAESQWEKEVSKAAGVPSENPT